MEIKFIIFTYNEIFNNRQKLIHFIYVTNLKLNQYTLSLEIK